MSLFSWLLLPSDAAVSVQVVQELTPESPVIVSHSGVLLPDVGAEPASTTTSRLPVLPRIASIALVMEPPTTLPAPFMVKAGPDQLDRLTSDALPRRMRSAEAWAGSLL